MATSLYSVLAALWCVVSLCGDWCCCVVCGVVVWWPQNREFTPIFHSERSHACGRPNFLLIRLEASQVPHPISLQCGEDKKLSGACEVAAERQEGIPRAMGASESLALCELLSLLFLVVTNILSEKCDKRWNEKVRCSLFSVVPVDMMASRSSQLVGHLFCFSSPCVWRFRLNRLGGRSGAIFNFTCFSSCLQKHDEQTTGDCRHGHQLGKHRLKNNGIEDKLS